MTPAEHDEVCAVVSHLPHVLASVFLETALARRRDAAFFGGPSFRDMTRVAGSSPSVWVDIFLTNRRLPEVVLEFKKNLERFLVLLEEQDEEGIRTFLERMVLFREGLNYGS